MLTGKKIIIGVCGSIAAYKIAHLIRLLIKQNAEVRIIMTQAATDFITPLTLATLAKHPIYQTFYNQTNGEWHNHVALGLWADLFLIAPATANTLAKMANGICDNLLTATYLSARCPVWIAPAMDLDMWQHQATQRNIQALQNTGNHLIPVGNGELASGLQGEGRMAEPEEIALQITHYFDQNKTNHKQQRSPYPTLELKGKKIIITAGPTYEPIDPVRFIGNHSSGKMGIAIADICAEKGAEVTLILGPTHLKPQNQNIQIIRVETAAQMFEASINNFIQQDIGIFAAAVADYTPAHVSNTKIKKKENTFALELKKTPDILAYIGTLKKPQQLLIGFALETNNEIANAIDKLQRKNLDLIILNSLQDTGAGFKHDTNKITLIDKNGHISHQDLKPKTEVANDIINAITNLINQLQNETINK